MTYSACVVASNEAFTLDVSVRSILPFVEEVVIFENDSFDMTREIMKELNREFGDRVRLIFGEENTSLAEARNSVQNAARNDWVIWWDADFVAYGDEDGKERSFKTLLADFEKVRHRSNQLLFAGPTVGPTFQLTRAGHELHGHMGDTQITKKGLTYFEVDKYVDSRRYTEERKCVYWNNGDRWHFLHVDIKYPERLAIRPFIYEYKRQRALQSEKQFPSLKDWYKQRFNRDFEINKIVNFHLDRIAPSCLPYDFGRWGEHPKIVESLLAACPFTHVIEPNSQIRVSVAP